MASSDPLDDAPLVPGLMGQVADARQQNPPLPFEMPSDTASRIATVANTEARVQYGVQRMKASALSASGQVPYTDPGTGTVTPVTDSSGAPITQYNKKANVGYDGGGFPVALRQAPTGAPIVEDAFANTPTTTDPKTGDQYQIRPGLPWKWTGTDDDVVQQNLQKEKDKATADLSTALGRKLTADEHQLTQDETEYKGRAKVLQKQFGLTGDEDPAEARAKIASSFDPDYQSPQATETEGWFGKTPSAAALQYRAGIDQQKQKALDAFDTLQAAQQPIAQRRVLLHNEAAARSQILDQQYHQALGKAQSLGAIPGVNEPGSGSDAGSSPAPTGASGPDQGQVGPQPPGPADHLAAAERGEKPYTYDPKAGLQFTPDKLSDGLKQATADGVVDPDWAKQHQPEFDKAQAKYDALEKSAGGNQQIKALLRGAGIGAAFNEAGAAVAPLGAAAGAAVSGPFAEIGAPIGAGLAYLSAGGLAAWAAKKGLDKLADYSDAVKSLNDAAALHPGWAAAGKLAGGARQIVQGAANLASVATMTDGLKAATGLLAKGAAGGLAFEGVLRPAFDAAVTVAADKLGIDHEAFQAPTVQSLLTSTAIGMVAAGHSIEFKDYNAGEISSVLTRAKIRTDAGIPLDADADPGALHAAFQKAGVNLDSRDAQEAFRPLTPEEISLRNSIKAQTQKMADAGKFDNATGVKFDSAKQANVPGITKGSGTQIASSVIKAVGGEEGGVGAEESPDPTPAEPKRVRGRDVTGKASAPAPETAPAAPAETAPAEASASETATEPEPGQLAKGSATATPIETNVSPAASQESTPEAPKQPTPKGGEKYESQRTEESTTSPERQAPRPSADTAAVDGRTGNDASQPAERGAADGASPAYRQEAGTVDQAAHEAAASPENDRTPPTPAQLEGGNAKLGHPQVGPLRISIEHPEGSARKPGWTPLKGAHYGYLKGVANSGDGEKMDAFVKTGTPTDYSGPVYVVNRHPAGGGVDHKVVLGASSIEDALKVHNDNYPAGLVAKPADVATFKDPDSFRKWAAGAKTRRAPAKGDGSDNPPSEGPASIYSKEVNGASKWMVQQGGKRGFGDSIHDTQEQAIRESSLMIRQASQRAETLARIKQEEATVAEAKAKAEDLDGFDSDMSPMQRGRVVKHLTARLNYKGQEISRRDLVRKLVNEGRRIEQVHGQRVLINSNDEFLGENVLTKAGLDYAQHLIEKKATHETAPADSATRPQGDEKAPEPNKVQPSNAGLAPEPQRPQPGPHTPESAVAAVSDEIQKYGGDLRQIKVRPKGKGDEEMGGGIAIHRTTHDIIHDGPTLARHASDIDKAGGDGAAWLRATGQEEAIHHEDLIRSGPYFEEAHARWWNDDALTPPAVREAVTKAYPEAEGVAHLMAEAIRMKIQRERYGHVTEEYIPGHDVSTLGPALDAWNPGGQLGYHLAAMRAPAEGVPEAPKAEAAPEKPAQKPKNQPAARGPPAAKPGAGLKPYSGKASEETRQGLKDLFDSLEALSPAQVMQATRANKMLGTQSPQGPTSRAFPHDKLNLAMSMASRAVAEGIKTPEELAELIDSISEKGRPYSQALWNIMGGFDTDEARAPRPNWPEVYSGLGGEPVDAPVAPRTSSYPPERLSSAVASELLEGKAVPRARLAQIAKEHAPDLSPKAVDEAAEAGVVQAASHIAHLPETAESRFDKMLQLYENQPNLTAKTSTSKIDQAYSTPAPLGFATSTIAKIGGETVVQESTAGNGMLLMEANPAKALVNEINPARAGNLRRQGFKVSQQDATKWVPGEKADVVHINPPFGTVKDATGKNLTWTEDGITTDQIDHAIALRSLQNMKEDGRAVLIIGGTQAIDPNARRQHYVLGTRGDFFRHLYAKYGVVDHFTVDGDLYKKQGAGWPVDVIVIAGRKPSPIQLPNQQPPRILHQWSEIRNELNRTDEQRIKAGQYDAERDRGELGDAVAGIRGAFGGGVEPIAPGGSDELAEQPGSAGSGSGTGDTVRTVPGDDRLATGEGDSEGKVGGVGAGPGAELGAGTERLVASEPRTDETKPQFHKKYLPVSKGTSFDIETPANLAGPQRTALERIEKEVGPLAEYVSGKLGYKKGEVQKRFSAEQMDSIASAIYNIEHEGALIMGHMTGVGKGRVVAALAHYARSNGMVPIFVTKNPKLYAAMLQDFHDIGKPVSPLFTNNDMAISHPVTGEVIKTGSQKKTMGLIEKYGALPKANDVLFTTYDQIGKDWDPAQPAASRKAAVASGGVPMPGYRTKAISALVSKGKVLFLLDEAHLAAGSSTQGRRLRAMLSGSNARALYSSATFAKRPDAMPLYFQTNLRRAANSPDDLVAAFEQGGAVMQQVASRMLAEDGQYTRLERTYDGIPFQTQISAETADRDKKLGDEYTRGLRSILDISNRIKKASKALNSIMVRLGKKADISVVKVDTVDFASQIHQFISQYLFSIKAEAAVQQAIQAIKIGHPTKDGSTKPHKVIVAIQNTMEGPIEKLVAAGMDLSYQGILLRTLDGMREIKTGKDPDGNPTGFRIEREGPPELKSLTEQQLHERLLKFTTNDKGEQVGMPDEAIASELFRRIANEQFLAAEREINQLDLGDMPISPIDHIRDRLQAQGIRTGEITGRSSRLSADKKLYPRDKAELGEKGQINTLNEFNNSNLDAMVVNGSGSTGLSAHASATFKNRAPRMMIIAQAHLDINEFMQMLGRIFRSGQVENPRYMDLQTALPAEMRPAAVRAKKMALLNANTTSNTDSQVSESSESSDIFNEYGDGVVWKYLSENPAMLRELRFEKIMGSGGQLKTTDEIREQYPEDGDFAFNVSKYMDLMLIEEQESFWSDVGARYDAQMAYLDQIGENKLKASAEDLGATTIKSEPYTPGTPGGTSAFDAPSDLETISVRPKTPPMEPSEVMQKAREAKTAKPATVLEYGKQASAWEKEYLAQRKEKSVTDWTVDGPRQATRLRAQYNEVYGQLQRLGNPVMIATNSGTKVGAIIGVEIDPESPLVPSKQIFIVANNTLKRTFKIPASQLAEKVHDMDPSDFETQYQATREDKVSRFMITGNLIAAAAQLQGKGAVTIYTKADGTLGNGILLPVDYDPYAVASRTIVHGTEDAQHALEAGRKLTSDDGEVQILKRGQEYVLSVPSSKSAGGKFWQDRQLLDSIRGGEFRQIGNRFAAPTSDLGAALDRLRAIGATLGYEKPRETLGAATPTVTDQDVAGQKLREFLARAAQRSEDEARGESILEDMQDRDVSPQDVVQDFWTRTYGNLPDAVQRRFQRMVKSTTGLQPGDVVGTQKQEDGKVKHIVADDWSEVFPATATSSKAEYLEGIERGLVVMMHLANQGMGNLRHAQPARPPRETLGAATPQPREVDPLGFYSHLAETVKQKIPARASVEQVIGAIKAGGVKAQEIEWTGLNEYLRTQQGPIDKAALLDFIRAGGVQLHEVQLQDTSDGTHEARQLVEAGLESSLAEHAAQAALNGNEGTVAKISAQYPDAKPILDAAMEVGSKATKFSGHKLPGGTNYKEVLLTLPRTEMTQAGLDKAAVSKFGRAFDELGYDQRSEIMKTKYPSFQSSHWDHPNVLAHIRQADHVDTSGSKVRLIEEIQSDWHQKGRKEGYSTPEGTAKIAEEGKAVQAKMNGMIADRAEEARAMGIARFVEHMEKTDDQYRDLMAQLDDLTRKEHAPKIPDAPFKKSWAELAFKRALALAVQDHMDKIAWTPGDTQAERYDLSKQIDRVTWNKAPSNPEQGKIYVAAHPLKGGAPLLAKNLTPSEIADNLGKDIADKIASGGQYGTLQGDGLKMGGEGMRGFYDKILPDFVRGYVKKWGGKVEESLLVDAGAKLVPVHSVEITTAMHNAVQSGQTIGALSPSAAAAASARAAGKGAPSTRADQKDAARAAAQNQVKPVSNAVNRMKSVLGRIKSAFTELPLTSSYRETKGEWLGTGQIGELGSTGRQKASIESRELRREIKKAVPNALSRMAIARYIEAEGDPGTLAQQAAASKGALVKVYERAQNLTPEEKEIADTARNLFDSVGREAMKAGLLREMLENYVTHFVDRSSIPETQKATVTQRVMGDMVSGKLNTDFKQARHRVMATMFDLEQQGYRLESSDIAEVAAAYAQSFANTLADRVFIKSLTQLKAADGRPLAVTSGSAKVVDMSESEKSSPLMVKPWTKPEESQDYMSVNHPALRKWGWATKIEGKDVFLQGELLVHPSIFQDLKNTLGRSKLNDVPLIRGITYLQGLAKQSMFAWSLFHYVTEGTHAIGHRVNPFKFHAVNPDDPITRELMNAGLFLSSDDARAAFGEGLSGGTLLDKVPWIGLINKALSDALFEDYIPGLKNEMAKDAFARNLNAFKKDLASGKISRAQVAQLTARQANDAFGGQNNMFEGTNPTQRHVEQLGLLAPDFLKSRARFFATAFTKYGTEQRKALFVLSLLLMVTAKVVERMLTGNNDWSKPFTVVTPHREYELRSVPGDVLDLIHDPRRFINGRLSPLISRTAMEALTGKDFRGRNRSVMEQIMDVVKTPIPISIRGFIDKDAPELSPVEQAGTAIGFRARRHSVLTDARILGHAWQKAQGKEPDDTVYPPSKYLGIRQALEDSDLAKARTNYYNLLRTMTREQINKGFTESLMHPFSGAEKTEQAFMQSLHGDDLRTYYAAIAERNRVMSGFQSISGYLGQARNPMFAKSPPPVFSNS